MTGRPGYRTMEMIGGSSASYLARTPCVPLFSTLFKRSGSRRAFRLPGAGGEHFHCTVEPSPGHIRCRVKTPNWQMAPISRTGGGRKPPCFEPFPPTLASSRTSCLRDSRNFPQVTPSETAFLSPKMVSKGPSSRGFAFWGVPPSGRNILFHRFCSPPCGRISHAWSKLVNFID